MSTGRCRGNKAGLGRSDVQPCQTGYQSMITSHERDRGCVDNDVDYDADEDDNDLLSGGADHLDRCLTLNQSLQLRRTFCRNLVLGVVNDEHVDDQIGENVDDQIGEHVDDQIGENMLINHRRLSSAVDHRRTEWPVAKRGSGDDDCHIDCVEVGDDDDGDNSVEPS